MIGELHDLRCTNDPCVCARVYRVREGYNRMTANEAANSRLADGPVEVLIPLRPGRSASRGMRP